MRSKSFGELRTATLYSNLQQVSSVPSPNPNLNPGPDPDPDPSQAAQLGEHKAALAWAMGELVHEAQELRGGATRLITAETGATAMLQRHEESSGCAPNPNPSTLTLALTLTLTLTLTLSPKP